MHLGLLYWTLVIFITRTVSWHWFDLLFDSISLLFLFVFIGCLLSLFHYQFCSLDISLALVLDLHMLLVFISVCCIHVFSFYCVFELCSIQLIVYLVSGISVRRSYSLMLMVLCMIIGSLLFATGMMSFCLFNVGYHDLDSLLCYGLLSSLVGVSLFAMLCVKIPSYPLLFWLPEAHVECSTDCSILLAAVLLKISIIGLLRFYGVFLDCVSLLYLLFMLCFVSIVISSLYTVLILDVKRIIAWSSIVHMNWSTLSLLVVGLLI